MQAACLYVLIGAIVVLVDSLQPAGIIVRVGHYVHVEDVFAPACRRRGDA
jgi:hypothetical protein